MDNKVLIAIIAVIAIVGGACGVFLLMGNGGDKSVPGLLNIEAPGTYENGTYDTVIICASVGDGDVLLKNIKIVKELIIRGGGSHSVTVDSCTLEGTVTTDKQGGQDIRIISKNTTITSVNAKSNTIFESTGTGSFESVTAEGTTSVTVQGSETKVDSVSMGNGTSLTVNAGSVNDVTMGDGTTMNVADGSVSNVNVGKDCSVTMQIGANGSVDTLTVNDNVSVTTSGEQTEAKLNEATIKMDSNADGAAVTINGEEKHVHVYSVGEIDWTNMDKADPQNMTVPATLECVTPGHETPVTLKVRGDRVEPTCTADGSITYLAEWDGKIYEYQIKDTIPATGHEYNVKFTWADDNSSATYVATCTHDRTHVEQGSVDSQTLSSTPATCTTDGSTVYSVSVTLSDGAHSDQKTVVQPKGHHYEIVDVDLMSVESGNDQSLTILATLVCTVCDDQTDGHEKQVRLPVVSGSESSPDCGNGTPGYLDMTLLYNGEELSFHRDMPAEHTYHISSVNTQDRDHPTVTLICRDCQHIVENIAGTPVITNRVEPDCDTPGSYMYHVECTYDGIPYQSLLEPVIIPLLGHNYQFNWEWGPNNLTATLIVTCARDGCEFQTECPAEVHVDSDATCTQAGDTTYTATAVFLNNEKTDTKSVSGEPLGHDYHITDVDWDTFDKNAMTVTATKVCSRCHDGDPSHSVTESVAVAVVITYPTCTLEGNRHYYVESPQENGYNESIPALGHYCEYTFEWSQDFASAIMHEVCTRDGCDYHKDYQASVNPVTTPSTCSAAGQTVYTATCTPDHGPQQTDTKTVSLPLAEHTYVITEIHWNTTLNTEAMTVEVMKTCSVCDESADGHAATETVAVLVETTPATCTEAGSNHFYVDGIELEGYDVAIPATGHHLTHHAGHAATCTEPGWQGFDTCDVCGHSTFAEIPALGHDLVHHDAKAPAVGEVGWDAYDTCNRGDYTTYVEIPALHGYTITVYGGVVCVKGNLETFTQMTVPEDTVVTVTYNGSDFGYWSDSYDDYIPGASFDILVACDLYVTAHDVNDREYGAWAVESEPTCTEDGLMCRTSGEFREYRVIPALGHISDGVLVVDNPAACTTAGAGHTTCERCHGEIDEVIEATGHHHVFTPEVLADGPIVGKLKGVCSECGHTVLKDYIAPIYPSGNIVVTFDQYHPSNMITYSDRDEIHTMWKFTDGQGVERQAYLYQIERDIHQNGYYTGVDVTTWVFWADYGAHSPVYIARHNQSAPVYGGASSSASWAVAGYADNLMEFAYFIDHMSAEVTIGGEEFHLTIGMDNGTHASALFDLYDAWADRFNSGMAGLYESRPYTYRGWECTAYSNEYETFYVNSDNCCLYWGREATADRMEVKSIVDLATAPFTQGYWNSNDFPLFSSYYFNSMPTLENSTYFCVKLFDGNYNSGDFTQGNDRINFFNGDSRTLVMWIEPNLPNHYQLSDIQVLNRLGAWVSVPFVLSNGHYVFDIQDKSINGLYAYMVEHYPEQFVMPNDPAFNGVYIRCVTSLIPTDSTVTVTGGTFENLAGEYVTTGGAYGGAYIYPEFDVPAGKTLTGISVTVNGGEPQITDNYWNYQVPAGSTVTITPVYEDVPQIYVEIIVSDGGTVDKQSGYHYEGDLWIYATPNRGYYVDGWYNVTDGSEPSGVNQISTNGTCWIYLSESMSNQTLKVIFKPVTHAVLEEMLYTEVYATNGFIHWEDSPVYVTALYGTTESETRMYVHADPNRDSVYAWDITSYAEDPNSQTQRSLAAYEWFDGNVKFCGELTTVRAVFPNEVHYYDLAYDLNGMEGSIQGGHYSEDDEVAIAEAPEWEGHNFLGWNSAQDGTGTRYDAGRIYQLTADVTLYAQWELQTVSVTVALPAAINSVYYTKGVNTLTATYGQECLVPANAVTVTKGFTITGWSYTLSGETQTIAADGTGVIPFGVTRVVAVCSYITYTVQFDKNDNSATGSMDDVTFQVKDLTSGKFLYVSKPYGFTKTGYAITSWTYGGDPVTMSEDNRGVSFNMQSFVEGSPSGAQTFTFRAVWTAQKYTVYYTNQNQSAVVGTTRGTFFGSDTYFYLPSQTNVTSGYNNYYLRGWTVARDGSGTLYSGDVATPVETIIAICNADRTVTLYAQWATKNYTVTFLDGNANDSQNMVYGSQTSLKTMEAIGWSHDGMTFVGWDTDPVYSPSHELFADGQTVSNLTINGMVTLYAVWVYDTYTVHFDANGEEVTGEMADQTFSPNEEKGLTPLGFTPTGGWPFVHWSTDPNNQGDCYENGQSVKNLTTEQSITLYAIWNYNC